MDILLENLPGKLPLALASERKMRRGMNRIIKEATMAEYETQINTKEDLVPFAHDESSPASTRTLRQDIKKPDASELHDILNALRTLLTLGRRPASATADVKLTIVGGPYGLQICSLLCEDTEANSDGGEGAVINSNNSKEKFGVGAGHYHNFEIVREHSPGIPTASNAAEEDTEAYLANIDLDMEQDDGESNNSDDTVQDAGDEAESDIDMIDCSSNTTEDDSEDTIGFEYDLAGFQDGLLDYEEFSEDFDDESETSSETPNDDHPSYAALPTISEGTCVHIMVQYIRRAIQGLRSNEDFAQSSSGQEFFETASELAEEVEQIWRKRWALESARKAYEVAVYSTMMRMPVATCFWRKNLSWPSLCRNIIGTSLRDQQMARFTIMIRTGENYPILRQLLPKGAYSILEHWSMELEGIVGSMVVKNNVGVVWDQMPLKSNTLFSGLRAIDNSSSFTAACVPRVEHALDPTIRARYHNEPRTGVAAFITRKLDQSSSQRTMWPGSVGVATFNPYLERKYTFTSLVKIKDAVYKEQDEMRNFL